MRVATSIPPALTEAPALPVVGGNSTVTHGRSQSDDYRTHGETRVQDGGKS